MRPQLLLILQLNCHRDAHAAADAEGGNATMAVGVFEIIQERYEYARAACPYWMP